MVSPGEQDECQQMERRHQYWIHREFKYLGRDQIWMIWRRWTLLGRDVDRAVGIGGISLG